jgi:acetyl esterase/lipase
MSMARIDELSLPGRLGNPKRSPATDPRIDPDLRSALAAYGLDVLGDAPPVDRSTPLEQVREFVLQIEAGFEGLYAALPHDFPSDRGEVDYAVQHAPGRDGREIALHVFKPRGAEAALPGVVYLHGGGMAVMQTFNTVHRQWCEDLAATGLVVIAVDFRNSATAAGLNPFPLGLNDCSDAVQWIYGHRDTLGVSMLVLQGESGGGNLVLATALAAKKEGDLDAIAGVYAMVPYISGAYSWHRDRKLAELPSLVENDGYYMDCRMLDLLAMTYDPTAEHAENPLAWPYFASTDDVAGLPPHVISTNELDPLRDEGMAYFRTLRHAGVTATGRVNLGITHTADSIWGSALPAVYATTVHDIKRFAWSLE